MEDNSKSKQKYQNDMFNKISVSSRVLFSSLGRDLKRINILQKGEIFEESQFLNLHLQNRQDLIKNQIDSAIKESKKQNSEIHNMVSYTEKKKLNSRKSMNIVLPSRTELLNKQDKDPKKMIKYLEDKKNIQSNSHNPKKKKLKKVNSLSNFEILNKMKSENFLNFSNNFYYSDGFKKMKSKNSVSSIDNDKMRSSDNFLNHNKPMISEFNSPTLSSITNNNIALKRIKFPSYIKSLSSSTEIHKRRKSIEGKRKKDLKKLEELNSQINKIKPPIEEFGFRFDSPFKRETVYLENVTLRKLKSGVKSTSLSLVKSQFKDYEKKQIVSEKSKFINVCSQIIKKHFKEYKRNENFVEKQKMKFEISKEKNKYGREYDFIQKIKKEALNYNRKTGVFIYNNDSGHKISNVDRLYSSRFNVGN